MQMNATRCQTRTIALLALFAIAIAAPRGDASADPTHAHPGARFETIEEAAVFALRYAHQTYWRYECGGLIVPRIGGGFTFTEPVGSKGRESVRFRIRPEAVAHFHTHTGGVPVQNKMRLDQGHSDADRAIVQHRDPLHRPSFVSYRNGKVWRFGLCSATRFCERALRPAFALHRQASK